MTHSNSMALKGHYGRVNRYAFIKRISILTLQIFICFVGTQLSAQINCPGISGVVCNDQVNITIPNGTVNIEPSMVSNSIPVGCLGEYSVGIYINGVLQGSEVSCTHSNQILDYHLIHDATGEYCSGTLLIEDKTGPILVCEDMDIACSEDSSVENLGHPEISDNCDPNPSIISFDNYIDYNCTNPTLLGTIERTWIAADNLGNTNTCVQLINIIRPDISGLTFPNDITISCTDGDIDPSITGGPSVAAMLSGNTCNFIIYFEDSETPVCTGTSKIIRRWYVTDWCTGDEIEDTQIIKIEDNTGPTITCQSELTFGANDSSCDATVTLPELTATDDCSNVVSVIPNWEFGSGNGPFENVAIGEYAVTYTAEDDCGNTSTCTTTVIIIDDVIPVATCDLITTVGIGESQSSVICADDIDSGSYDNCELASRAIRLVGDTSYTECISLTCAQVGQTLSVEMQVIDVNGLENHCTVEVIVFDKIAPVISSCASDITINCDDDVNDLALTGSIIVTDNCAFDFGYTDVANVNECNVGEIIRTFTATDNSGNTSSCTQIITTQDNTTPIIQFSEDLVLVCVSINDDLGKPSVEDNCGKFAFSFEDHTIEDNECIQSFHRTWEVLNLCTNESYSETVKIILQNDLTLPQFSGAPVEITVSCNEDIPNFIAPTISDVCDDNLTIEIVNTDVAGQCPATRILTRTYIATDACGNSDSFTQTISLIDDIAPVFVNFPDNQTINCDEVINQDLPDVFDSCDSNPTISFVNDTIPGDCLNEIFINRTYTIRDECGNETIAIQTFRFVDNVPPIIRGQTNDLTISCQFIIPAFDLAAVDNCDNDLTIEVVDASIPGDCPNEEFITRIYTVIDDCGNNIKDTIAITVIDDRAPVLTASNLVENLTIACDQTLPAIDFSLRDNCDSDIDIIESRDTSGTPCDLIVVRAFTATDDCGNASTLTQNLNIIDNQPPFFASFPQDRDVTIFSGESIQVDVIDATIIDNCTEDTETTFVIDFFNDGDQPEAPNVFVDGVNASGVYPIGSHTVSFTTTDNCGNVLNQDLDISVVDFSPSALCTSITLEIGENGLLQVLTSAVLEDPSIMNSGSIQSIQFVNPSNFTQVIGTNLLLDCDDIGLNQFAVEIINNNGESSVCSNMIELIDPDNRCGNSSGSKAAIAGKIIDLDGMPLKNIEINLTNTETRNKITDQFGVYAFEELPIGSACQVQPTYDYDHVKDVTTFDMVLVMQHILQSRLFTNPYQHIAADVDMNGKVDLFDLVEIRSLILYQIDRFNVSPSYRFIEKSYEFSNPEDPLTENIPDMHTCPSLDENMIGLDFYSIKMGDIDGTKVQNLNETLEERNSSPFTLLFKDELVQENEETSIQIQTENINDIAALQFTLALNEAEIIAVDTPNDLSGNYFWKAGKIHFAWIEYDGDLSKELFNIRIRSNQTSMLSELISIDQKVQSAKFDKSGQEDIVVLKETTESTELSEMVLQQNTPNPFSDETTIKFYLPKEGITELQITDLSGKTVYRHQDTYESGWHEHRYSATQLSSGIYIYTLTQGQQQYSKKMVVTK